jgi:hypothetical protein
MLALIGSFLIKLLGSGIVTPVLEYFKQKSSDAVTVNGQNVTGDVSITQAQLTAYVEERKVIAAERAKIEESLWTAWMIPTAFGFALFHFAMIVLDSVFRFGWGIAKLPPPYDQLQWTIIGSVIGVSGVSSVIKRVFR